MTNGLTNTRTCSRGGGRRGRAAIIWGCLWFAACQLSLSISLESLMPDALDIEYGLKLKSFRQRFASTEPSRVVLMIGSSLTIDGARPIVLEQHMAAAGQPALVHNFGIHGGGPLTELLVTRRLLHDGVRPDLVLVEVAPPFLAGRSPILEMDRYPGWRLWGHEVDVVARYLPGKTGLRRDWWLSRLTPWHAFRDYLLGKWDARFLPIEKQYKDVNFIRFDETGWYGTSTLSAAARARARDVLDRTFSPIFKDYTVDGRPRQALEEMLDLFRQHEIPVVLVLMPESSEFRELYTSQAWNEAHAYITGLASGRSLPLVNARQWIADDGFGDACHLHARAAGEFSERLARQLPVVERLASPGPATRR